MDESDRHFEVAIVGGGPAGQSAAEALVGAGFRVCIIDEQPRLGGQILRRPPSDFELSSWLPGALYRPLKAQLARTEALPGLVQLTAHSVVGLFRESGESGPFRLQLAGQAGGVLLTAGQVLVAGGCYDMPVPVPGWTLPGAMSAGGVQTLLKGQQLLAGDRLVLAGTHPLMLIVADQFRRAGGTVAGILFAQPLQSALATAARHFGLVPSQAGKFIEAGRAWLALRAGGVPIHFGAALDSIDGSDAVERVRARKDGRTIEIACDLAATCFGFLPQSDLPRMAGAETLWAEPAGGWRTVHDAWMRTSISGLFVAGETAGVAGADVALEQGRLAALGMLLEAGKIRTREAESRARGPRRRLLRLDRFTRMLAALAAPANHLPPLTPDTILCRCEDVPASDIVRRLGEAGAPASANAVKLASRAGMGLCQGRSCEHNVRRMLAEAGLAPGAAFAARFPCRPTPIGDFVEA